MKRFFAVGLALCWLSVALPLRAEIISVTPGGASATSVTAAAVLTANQVVVGDDGVRGVKTANANTIININGGTAPTPSDGSVFQLVGANAAIARVEAASFGAIAAFTAKRANGTSASPTALMLNNQIGGFDFFGYYVTGGPGYAGPAGSVQGYAAEAWTSTANGTYIVVATTPAGSTTLTEAARFGSDQSLTVAGRWIGSVNGALSAPAFMLTGIPISGGTATTTKPMALIETVTATSANWSTGGTLLGVNGLTGFTGNLIDLQLNGAARFKVANNGVATINAGAIVGGSLMVGSGTPLTMTAGAIGMLKITASGNAPGALGGKMELVCGTVAGTAKLVIYAGTSTVALPILDGIGGGVTGC